MSRDTTTVKLGQETAPSLPGAASHQLLSSSHTYRFIGLAVSCSSVSGIVAPLLG